MNYKLMLVNPLTLCCQVTYKDMFAVLCVAGSRIFMFS